MKKIFSRSQAPNGSSSAALAIAGQPHARAQEPADAVATQERTAPPEEVVAEAIPVAKPQELTPQEAAIRIQKLYRSRFARKRLRLLLQETLEKFYDEATGLYYYYNKHTQQSTWTKPKLIQDQDIPLSPLYAKEKEHPQQLEAESQQQTPVATDTTATAEAGGVDPSQSTRSENAEVVEDEAIAGDDQVQPNEPDEAGQQGHHGDDQQDNEKQPEENNEHDQEAEDDDDDDGDDDDDEEEQEAQYGFKNRDIRLLQSQFDQLDPQKTGKIAAGDLVKVFHNLAENVTLQAAKDMIATQRRKNQQQTANETTKQTNNEAATSEEATQAASPAKTASATSKKKQSFAVKLAKPGASEDDGIDFDEFLQVIQYQHNKNMYAASFDFAIFFGFKQIEKLRGFFIQLDADASGELDQQEILQLIRKIGIDSNEQVNVKEIIQEVDVDHNGTISFDEFLQIVFNLNQQSPNSTAFGKLLASGIAKGVLKELDNVVHKSVELFNEWWNADAIAEAKRQAQKRERKAKEQEKKRLQMEEDARLYALHQASLQKQERARNTPVEGFRHEVEFKGDGVNFPNVGQFCRVHYVGMFEDGKIFESSRKRGGALEFCVGAGHLIQGWEIALQRMSVGETAKITLAPGLAYGVKGRPPKIPPNATLVFRIELISIKEKQLPADMVS